MGAAVPTCHDMDQRLALVRASSRNGIDYVEPEQNPRVLNIYLMHEAPDRITTDNVRIAGGVRVRDIKVTELRIGKPGGSIGDARLQVVVDRPGDLSTYRLSLVETDALGVPTDQPMAEFDPLYASIDFTFRERFTTQLDCKPTPADAPPTPPEPDINYLAKDYASFRQLILDRLALTMPQWQESHVPDLGIALVEILAYVGDYLSYYQDAVATEAYLNTARKRVSVRRHLRLLDYRMHDGCNARVWVCLNPQDSNAPLSIPSDSIFFVSADAAVSAADQIDVFEPVATQTLHVRGSHVAIPFYCWGNTLCQLPVGTTRATLRDGWDGSNPPQRLLDLRVGDFLCFEQVLGVTTGSQLDADPTQRHVVRLTRVEPSTDVLYDPPIPLVTIEWAQEDALPFALVLSATGPAPGCELIENISVAHGNVFLADEGLRVSDEDPDPVPLPPGSPEPSPYRPTLAQPWIISTRPLSATAPAQGLLDQDPALALPWIRLRSIPGKPDGTGPLFEFADLSQPAALLTRLTTPPDTTSWFLRSRLSTDTRRRLDDLNPGDPLPDVLRAQILADLGDMIRLWVPKADLLKSRPTDPHFVVEIDADGIATLRFGKDGMGITPAPGETFRVTYRVALDTVGHVAAESITKVTVRPGAAPVGVLTVRNPLPASGRVAPQSIDEARTIGPGATSAPARAVTAEDYAKLAERNPRVQRAAAVLLWTGSRYEARVAIDPLGSEAVEPQLLQTIRTHLEPYRSIGHDLTVVPATYVPIDLSILVRVRAGHSRAYVEKSLRDAFRRFFHPDNLTFGQNLEIGTLMAVAHAVPGVESVEVKKLERLFEDPGQQLEQGVLAIGPMEVARLDNDATRPENGRLNIQLRGGR